MITTTSRWYYILYPMRTYIIAASYGDASSAMAADWVMPVSLNPPLLAVAISPKRYTHGIIMKSREFTVNTMDYKYYSETFCVGNISGKDYPDKITRCGLSVLKARKIQAPVIREATGVVECKLEASYPAGDHNIIVGRVIEAYMLKDMSLPPSPKDYKALLHAGRALFTTTIDELVEAEEK